MSYRRKDSWHRKLYYFFYFNGEVVYFWICVLIGSLFGLGQLLHGATVEDHAKAVADFEFDQRYSDECGTEPLTQPQYGLEPPNLKPVY
jgi:hypothetical protein